MNTASIHPTLLERKIIHFDMDAFYASVEVRDDPSLRGKPVVIGGSPQSRGVVCTASYEARKFGIHSAMSCARAYRLCPQAIFLRPNFEKYRTASQQIREIFASYTDKIEPLSLDEAYLDVTQNSRGLYAIKVARLMQQEILQKTGLTGSAGVGPNKLIAKIASDMRKPFGLTLVLPEHVAEFMRPLSIRKIHGIGPATEKKLEAIGFKTCGDFWQYSIEELTEKLGERMAEWLHARSRGLDNRRVDGNRVRKSLGKEDTFATDILDVSLLKKELRLLSESVAKSLVKRSMQGRTITIKVKYADFESCTRSLSLESYTNSCEEIFAIGLSLLEKTEAGQRKVRLLGVSVSNFGDEIEEPEGSLNLLECS